MAKLPDIIKSRLWVLVNENDDEQQIMYETSGDIVTVESTKFAAKNVLAALNEIADMAANGGVTGVKGDKEQTYRTGNVNLTPANIGAEPAFTKNTAFNKNFGTDAGTVMQGNDSRVTTAVSDIAAIKQKNTEQDTAIANKIDSSEKGARNGVATLDAQGLIPSSQLPSYVDDVLEFDSKSNFPATGEDGKIYIAKDTNLQYRWSGTAYVEISPSLALGETAQTAYPGNKGKQNADDIAAIKAGTTAAGKVAHVLAIRGKLNSTDELQEINFDGSAARQLDFEGSDFKYVKTNGTLAEIRLQNSGVAEGSYNFVTVDTKGRVYDAQNKDYALKSDVPGIKVNDSAMSDKARSLTHRINFISEANNGTDMTCWFDGIVDMNFTFDPADFASFGMSQTNTKPTTLTMRLANTGVVPNKTYSAVTVDAKGRVTEGFRSFAIIEAGAAIPDDVPVGGLIIEKIAM